MIAILLVGIVAYNFLPLSALPEVDYPTIQVQTFYPGASPEVMTSSVTAPLERQFGQMPSLSADDVAELGRRLGHHAALRPRHRPRHRRAGSAGGDQRGRQSAARRPAGAADLRQGQSGRRADPDARRRLRRLDEAHRGRGHHREPPRAETVAIARRRPGFDFRRPAPEPCASTPIRSRFAAYGLNLDDLRTTIANLNVNTPKGNFDGPSQSFAINANDQIRDPNDYANSVIAFRNGAPVRLTDVATVEIAPENSKLSGLDEHDAGAHRQHPAPARRQRHPGRRQHQEAVAVAHRLAARGDHASRR